MEKILTKINWKTRRWKYKFDLLGISLRDEFNCWGLRFCTFTIHHYSYSLLNLKFVLPNNAEVSSLRVVDWDFLFLHRPLVKIFIRLDEKETWGNLTKLEEIKLKVLNKIFN